MTDFTKHSKLSRFFKADASPLKRVRAVLSFAVQASRAECTDFFKQNSSKVYKAVLDTLQQQSFAAKKGESVSTDDITDALRLMGKMMEEVKDLIRRKWQVRSIGNTVMQLLMYCNVFDIRQQGLSLLLKFIDILGSAAVDQNILDLLSTAVDMRTFSSGDKVPSDVEEYFASSPLNGPPELIFSSKTQKVSTSVDSLKLLDFIFDFAAKQSADKFVFWYKLLKEQIFPMVYPSVVASLSVAGSECKLPGFKPECPHAVEELVVLWIERCLQTHRDTLIGTGNDMNFVQEVFRQSFLMPTSYSSVIIRVLGIFTHWVEGEYLSAYTSGVLQETLCKIIDQVSSCFYWDLNKDRTGKALATRIDVCGKAIRLFYLLAEGKKAPLTESTWEKLLLTVLNASNYVITMRELQSLQASLNTKARSESDPHVDFESQLFAPLLDCLYTCYLTSNTRTTLWEVLQEKVRDWIDCRAVLVAWKKHLISLTNKLLHGLADELKSRSPAAGSYANPVVSELPAFTEAFRVWDHFLHIVGPPTSMETIEMRELALDGWISTLYIFLDAVTKPPPKLSKLDKIKLAQGERIEMKPQLPHRQYLPQGNTLLRIFGPSLFEACNVPDPAFITGRATAYGALCRLFGTRGGEPFDPVFLSAFYQLLHLGFTFGEEAEMPKNHRRQAAAVSISQFLKTHRSPASLLGLSGFGDDESMSFSNFGPSAVPTPLISKQSIRWTIMKNSASLFAVNLPGINILIPDYLRTIDRLLLPQKANTTPRGIRLAAVSVLLSWVALPYHYGESTLPDLRSSQALANKRKSMMQLEAELELKFQAKVRREKEEARGVNMTQNPVFGGLRDVPEESVSESVDEPEPMLRATGGKNWGTYTQLKREIHRLLLRTAESKDNVEPLLVSKCLWGLCVMALLEIDQNSVVDSETENTGVLRSSIGCLIRCCSTIPLDKARNPSPLIAHTAVEGLKVLAFFQSQMPKDVVAWILVDALHAAEGLVALVTGQPEDHKVVVRGKAAEELLYCSLDWIMLHKNPVRLLNENPKLSDLLFRVLGMGILSLNGARAQMLAENSAPSLSKQNTVIDASDNLTVAESIRLLFQASKRPQEKEHKEEVESLPGFAVACKAIQEAADSVVRHLMNRAGHFPLPDAVGPEVVVARMEEDHVSDELVHYVYDSTTLVSVSRSRRENSALSASTVPHTATLTRVVVRDKTGKYVWDFSPVDEGKIRAFLLNLDSAQRKAPEREDLCASSSQEEKVDEHPRLLQRVLEMLNSTHKEDDLLQTRPMLDSQGSEEATLKMLSQVNQERLLRTQQKEMQTEVAGLLSKGLVGKRDAPPTDNARALMSQLYLGVDCPSFYLPFETGRFRISPLEVNSKLQRSLKLLDNTNCREAHKLGVIYVGNGQEDQSDILRNEKATASEAYLSFVDSLGWKVDIATHRGFKGGLDERSTGPESYYWATSVLEVMYHVVTSMKTDHKDPQQIQKKRQVGNDHVHIVWSDHSRDYRPSTISSQFNDAHIVVYPLENELFRVQVFSKPQKVPPFGPLQDGMMVPFSLLAPLVRLTSLNANRSRRYATKGYGRPYPTRQKYINDIIERHAQSSSPADLVSQLFP